RTSNQKELAEIYSAADVFVNPMREDNYPTVNLEAISCGTPVVTFRTGGSPESVGEGCGIVVPKDDTDAVVEAVRTVCRDASDHSSELASMAESFDSGIMTGEYLKLYRRQ
ncbi:MAG: glycosyltransferase, partial [Oscillospiraceae bacterium]|nr:glycosyltransferase [Oscillospiraceae bacterium]